MELLLSMVPILFVQLDLEDLGTVHVDARALARDLRGRDNVLEDRLVDRGQSAVARAHLVTLAAEVLVHDGAVSHLNFFRTFFSSAN